MRLVSLAVLCGCASSESPEVQRESDPGAAARAGAAWADAFVVNFEPGEWMSITMLQKLAAFGTPGLQGGDFNDDGYADVVAGAVGFDHGQVDEGAAFLFPGGENGVGPAPAWVTESNDGNGGAGARYGNAVESGDVNGDGFLDLVIGAPWWSRQHQNEGAVFAFHGSPTGLAERPTWRVESDIHNEQIGSFLACADLNGDGMDEVIFHGIPNSRPPGAVIGSSSGEVDGVSTQLVDVSAIASAGDVNGDGFEDLAVLDDGLGRLHLGSPIGVDPSETWSVEVVDATGEDWSIQQLRSAGDVNGDEFDDIIAGSPFYDAGNGSVGAAFVYLGSPSGPSDVADWTSTLDVIVGDEPRGPSYGYAVSSAGDINGDGFGDVAVGAYLHELDTTARNAGVVYLFYGSPDGLPDEPSRIVHGRSENAQMGFSLAPAGDVDADGFDELIVGGAGDASSGAIFVVQGRP